MIQEKILVIQTAFLGDAILTLPMIQKLKEANPLSRIDVISTPSTSDVFDYSPHVHDVWVFDKHKRQKSLYQLFSFIKMVKRERYTKIYSPHRSFRTALIVLFSGVRETYGFDTASMSFVYKYKIKYQKEIHEVARNLELIGIDTSQNNWKILPEIVFTEKEKNKIRKKLPALTGNTIAIAPGSVWNTKIYPQEYFEKISEYLLNKNYTVLLVGGEKDRQLCKSIKQKFKGKILSVAGKLNPEETIALLKEVDLLICNDSAPTHMGMAAGIPVLTIYCSTVPQFGFYPYNDCSAYVSYNDLKCKPCGIHGHRECPVKTFDCAKELTPDIVINKIEELLADKKNRL